MVCMVSHRQNVFLPLTASGSLCVLLDQNPRVVISKRILESYDSLQVHFGVPANIWVDIEILVPARDTPGKADTLLE